MKYVIVKRYEDELVKLTKPATATQARNSLERFKELVSQILKFYQRIK